MTKLNRWWWQLWVLAILAVLSPACGGGGSKKIAPPLFQDSFGGVFPGTSWTAPAITGSATAAIDPAAGFPMPSLKMTTIAATASVKTTTTMAFNNPMVTFSVTMADLSAAMTELGTGTITIFNATPASIAFASWDNATGKITFHINGATDVLSGVIPANGNFHRIVFSVNAAGTATWTLDNGAALVSQAIPAGMLKLELGATFGTGSAWPSFFFDNVIVTSP